MKIYSEYVRESLSRDRSSSERGSQLRTRPTNSARARSSTIPASTRRPRRIPKPSGRGLRKSSSGSSRGRRCSSGTRPMRSGLSAARSTSAPTASIVTCAPRAATRPRSSGKVSRRSPHAHLLRSLSPGLPVRERPEVARREERRPRRALPAADSRAGDRDARVRAHRRGALGRLRRLQRRVASRSHQRLVMQGARHRGRRLAPRPDRAAQADRRRSADRTRRRSSTS